MKVQVLEIDEEILRESIKANDEKRFYVYIHRTVSDNKPFYVGKGTRYRALYTKRRSLYWHRIAEKHGVYVQIYKNRLTSEEACEIEKELIKHIGLKKLANVSEGGEGGLVGKLNHFYGKRFIGEKNGNYMNRGIKNPLSKPILCFDLNGVFLKEYDSIADTERIDGFCASTVTAVCLGKRRQHKGCFFVYKSEYNKNQTYTPGITNPKSVICYDKDKNFIKEYASISKTKEDGFCPKKVSAVCLGKRKSHKNHFWQYKI
jgi:hypothetical protein